MGLTKRVHACPPRLARGQSRPRLRLLHDAQALVERRHARAEVFEEQVRRDNTVLHSQGRLHQAGDTGSALGMADDSFHTANVQWVFIACGLSVVEEGA